MLFILPLIVITTHHITLASTTTITSSATVKEWGNKLAAKFASFLDDTMLTPTLQKMYDDVPVTTTYKQGSVECAASAARLSTLLNAKDESLRLFGSMCWSPNYEGTFQNHVIHSAKAIVGGLTKDGDEQIMRVYFTPHNDGKTILHSVDGRTDPNEVAPTKSTASYTPIDSVNPTPSWIQTESYDARRTGWYANAVAGPKDIFIIVDESGIDSSAFQLLKDTLHHLLNTISPNDNIFLQRRTVGQSSSVISEGATVTTTPEDLLAPLGDESCMAGVSRGTHKVVDTLQQLSTNMHLLKTMVSPSSANDWLNMFQQTFKQVNIARTKLRNKRRAGAILILSSGEIESVRIQNTVVPYGKNKYLFCSIITTSISI